MTTKAIREKLVKYLQVADDKKVKAIYMMVYKDIVFDCGLFSDSSSTAYISTSNFFPTYSLGMGRKILLFSGVTIVFVISAVSGSKIK